MAYTPPNYNNVDFGFGSNYTPPSYNEVDFVLCGGTVSTGVVLHVLTNSVFKEAVPSVLVGGSWRDVSAAYVLVGGVWKTI